MSKIRLTRRHLVLRTGACAVVASVAKPAIRLAAAQPLPKRKNIDALSATELDDYKHAVGILKQRSAADATRQDGYVYQANLHNKPRRHPDNSVGACEHGSEQFFPWHRPHLAGFEKLLRESDPPRTANVTLPYWDWSKPPSGSLFPTAFEDQSSPLFNAGRVKSGPPPMWDAADILDMVRETKWDLFAGRPKGPDQSYGEFEDTAHNTMHGNIGPTMGSPSTAAMDPIYWSFHAFVDLTWARWQRLHTQTFACGDCTLWLEPNSFKVNQLVTTKDWGYEYDFNFDADGPPAPVVASAGATRTLQASRPTPLSLSAPLDVPQNDKRKLLKIEKVVPLRDANYRIQVYVHPADVVPANLTEEQAKPYLVRTVTIWQSEGHHPAGSDVLVDVTKALAQPGPERRVSIVVRSAPIAGAPPTPLAQPLPSVQDLVRGLAVEEH